MDEADRLSDRVAIIDHGKLLLLDTPENLKKTIGEGDVVEIELDPAGTFDLGNVTEELLESYDQITVTDTTLMIKSTNLIESVSDITQIIKSRGVNINSDTLRENTLEDVFIHLTGRTLRQ